LRARGSRRSSVAADRKYSIIIGARGTQTNKNLTHALK